MEVYKVEGFVGKRLDAFSIQKCTEVYKTDVDGRKQKIIGYFRSDYVAKAFAKNQIDPEYHRTSEVFLLTDGVIGFPLTQDSVELLDEQKALLEIRQSALAKLTPEERKILGL